MSLTDLLPYIRSGVTDLDPTIPTIAAPVQVITGQSAAPVGIPTVLNPNGARNGPVILTKDNLRQVASQIPAATVGSTQAAPSTTPSIPSIRNTSAITSLDQIPPIKTYQPDPARVRAETALQSTLAQQESQPTPQGFWGNARHILNDVANAAGDVFLGGNNMAMIPGTILNRAAQHNAGERELALLKTQDIADQTAFDREQAAQGQNQLRIAQALKALYPDYKPLASKGADGKPVYSNYDPRNGETTPTLDSQGKPVGPFEKLPEADQPLTNVLNLQKDLQNRYEVLHPGATLPSEYALPPNPTQKDYDRIDKALEGEERAESTKEQQDQTRLLHQQAEADRQAALAMQQTKLSAADRKEIYTIYQPSMQSAERFNVMAQNYEDAVKNHDQQAMLSLLANHLGMTMGLQKGARLNKDIINEAKISRPWLQGMDAKFDKDGYLSGVTLTKEQMRQMVDLGASRYREDTVNARDAAKYMGSEDDGPERTPNAATIRYYTGLANGDAGKAKQLATEDGWTIK